MVSLETLRRASSLGTHVHFVDDEFTITSSVPLFEITTCEVLSRAFPGRIGRYVLPRDAVLKLRTKSQTTATDVKRLLHTERSLIASAHISRMNHVTVQKEEETNEEEYDTEEEDETVDDAEDEQENDATDELSEEEEEDVVDDDWDEDSCQNGTEQKKKMETDG